MVAGDVNPRGNPVPVVGSGQSGNSVFPGSALKIHYLFLTCIIEMVKDNRV